MTHLKSIDYGIPATGETVTNRASRTKKKRRKKEVFVKVALEKDFFISRPVAARPLGWGRPRLGYLCGRTILPERKDGSTGGRVQVDGAGTSCWMGPDWQLQLQVEEKKENDGKVEGRHGLCTRLQLTCEVQCPAASTPTPGPHTFTQCATKSTSVLSQLDNPRRHPMSTKMTASTI